MTTENKSVDATEINAEEATSEYPYVLEVEHLKKYFPIEKSFFGKPMRFLKAVDDVSFKLKEGETIGIVGESGCGKTTMGRTVLKLYSVDGGRIIFRGTDITNYTRSEMRPLRKDIQIIFQDPYSSLSPRFTVGEIIGEAVKVHKIVPDNELKGYVLHVMAECGLQSHFYDRYPHEFSGGQRQRICIARALALQPTLIICDEPVSALDVSIQAQIINLLKDLQDKRKISYVFISHDLSVVEHISTEIGVMYLGNMVEKGAKKDIFANPLHPYTKALFSAIPYPDPRIKMNRIVLSGDIPSPANPPSGCKFHTRCQYCTKLCETIPPEYREVEENHFCACHLYNSAEDNERLQAEAEEILRQAEQSDENKNEKEKKPKE